VRVGVGELAAEDGPLLVVIGVFDGLHLGHRYLLDHLVDEASVRGARPTVVTFDSHPDEVLVGAAPPLLLDPADRLVLLAELGVEVVVVEHFDDALRSTEYDDFIHRITARSRLAGILMTPDAAFGHDRRGTPETVRVLAEVDGFDLVVVPPFELDGRSVRSSDIRDAILAGDLTTASALLGRPYRVRGMAQAGGSVVPDLPAAMPPDGAYRCRVDGRPMLVSIEAGRIHVPGVAAPRPVTVEWPA
jgi:riboflavin kinase/FMN adenylyltransferase